MQDPSLLPGTAAVASSGRPDPSAVERLLAQLDPEQRAVVLAPSGPVRILAGAGTGKTTTLAARMAWRHHTGHRAADQTLALTHSVAASGHLRSRLAGYGVRGTSVHTFHAAALALLTRHWAHTRLPGAGPRVLEDPRTLLRELGASSRGGRASQVAIADAEIAWAHSQVLSPVDYPAAATAAGRHLQAGDVDQIGKLYGAYENTKRVRGVLDFDDLLRYLTQLIERSPHVAASVRARFPAVVVDEYQDTDPAQQMLLLRLLGDGNDVTVVGDAAQAIYGFKGGTPDFLVRFGGYWPAATTFTLTRNYRSVPAVVAAANRVAATIPGSVILHPTASPVPAESVPAESVPAESVPVESVPVESVPAVDLFSGASEAEEGELLVGRIRALLSGGLPADEVAVLCRFHQQADRLRDELAAAGVPVETPSREAFFTRPDIVGLVRAVTAAAAADPEDDAVAWVTEELDARGWLPDSRPAAGAPGEARWRAWWRFLRHVEELAQRGVRTLGALAEDLHDAVTAEAPPLRSGGVLVATIHHAKGLEFDHVFVPRCVEGSLPSALARSEAERAEERRLFYVAVTRARVRFTASWARHWHGTRTRRSPYLDDVGPLP